MPMKIALVPLDDRPVSTTLVRDTLAIAGADVLLPSPSIRPHKRLAPNLDALQAWTNEARAAADACVASLDALSFGSLIGSRIRNDDALTALGRWAALTTSGGPVHAAIVVPRTPDSDDAMEEPDYWDPHGPALHQLSFALAADEDLHAANTRLGVPENLAHDWLSRRLRQHTLAHAAIDLANRGRFTSLFIGVDDAAPGSLSALAQRELSRWTALLDAGGRVIVGPGADEAGLVLAVRALIDHHVRTDDVCLAPQAAVVCAVPDGLQRIAAYETGPVLHTVHRQLRAVGAQIVEGDADVVLVVHAPAQGVYAGDWAVGVPEQLDFDAAARTVALARRYLDAGAAVGIADVAHPNGADPALIEAITAADLWPHLHGYAGWNTAGNTIGTVVGQLVASHVGLRIGVVDRDALQRAIAHRIVEDYGWMSIERARLRAEIGSIPGHHDHVDLDDARRDLLARRLTAHLHTCWPDADFVIGPDTVRLPWQRTFEIDFIVHPALGRTADGNQ